MLLVRLAMTRLMPTEEPRLRISVHSAAPSVRISPGSVAKAMVLSGTNTKPEADALADRCRSSIVHAETSGVQPTIS